MLVVCEGRESVDRLSLDCWEEGGGAGMDEMVAGNSG